jgi:hypothetical protein
MKSYLVKISGREEGPYSDSQIAQMFADGRVNRYTPCRKAEDKDWRTIDDYLPTLKYGTQLPPPTLQQVQIPSSPSATVATQRVAIVDFDMPFGSILKIMFKWTAAAFVVWCCFIPVIITLWLIVMTLFAGLIGGAMSNLPRP